MAEIIEFSAIDELESKKIALKNCIAQNSSGDSCSKCKRVFGCDRIKEFVILQFDIATARLKDCQKANNLSSCMDCDRIFDFMECFRVVILGQHEYSPPVLYICKK